MNLTDHTLKVAVLRVRNDRTSSELAAARAAAERDFATARKAGIKQLTVALPGNIEAGTLVIHKGGVVVAWDDDKLFPVVESSTPHQIRGFLYPEAFTDDRVVKLIRDHFPEYVGRRVSAERLAELTEEVIDTGGKLLDLKTGEMVQVATVTRYDPTGKFTYTPSKKDLAAIGALLDSGVLTPDGRVAEPGEAGASTAPGTDIQAEGTQQ